VHVKRKRERKESLARKQKREALGQLGKGAEGVLQKTRFAVGRRRKETRKKPL